MKEFWEVVVDGTSQGPQESEDDAWKLYDEAVEAKEFTERVQLFRTKLVGEAIPGVVRTVRRRKRRAKKETKA